MPTGDLGQRRQVGGLSATAGHQLNFQYIHFFKDFFLVQTVNSFIRLNLILVHRHLARQVPTS